ncbi:MAG: hypothetical protein LC650_01860 [Actinobacteria bacterium]|nr:hypothetical protein [Actinomycetota bacterium]
MEPITTVEPVLQAFALTCSGCGKQWHLSSYAADVLAKNGEVINVVHTCPEQNP